MNSKKIKSCSATIVAQHLTNPETISNQFNEFFVNFLTNNLLDQAGMNKRSGVEAIKIIQDELALRLNQTTIGTNAITMQVDTKISIDTFYNYQKRPYNDVLTLTTFLSRNLDKKINSTKAKTLEDDLAFLEEGIFIIDDTPYERLYSKQTELASSQFDHTNGHYYTGYRNNQLGYYRNGHYLPVNAVLVSTTDSNKAVSPAKETGSVAGERKRELTQSKMNEVSLKQLDLALEAGFKGQYCLFDTWYANPKMFSKLLDRGIHGIGMIKNSSKVKFSVDGKSLSTKEIFEENKYNLQQILNDEFFFSVEAEAEYKGKTFPIKLCFYTSNSPDKDFICIGTTDLSLSYRTIHLLYKIRWSTENYFADTKDIKSICANKQCQCLSLDSIYFDVAMTEILYLFLAYYLYSQDQDCSVRLAFHKVAAGLHYIDSYSILIRTLSYLIDQLSKDFNFERTDLIKYFAEVISDFSGFTDLFSKISWMFKPNIRNKISTV